MKLNTAELVQMVQEQDIAPAKFVQPIIMEYLKQVRQAILEGKSVGLPLIGLLYPQKMKQRKIYSIKTTTEDNYKTVPEHTILKLRPSDTLKKDLWNKVNVGR